MSLLQTRAPAEDGAPVASPTAATEVMPVAPAVAPMSGLRKAAIVMLNMDRDVSAEVLRHLGEGAIADRVVAALGRVLASGIRTRDLGGTASTRQFTDAICKEVGGRE